MTEQEAAALAQILSRIPLTRAEALWLRALIERLTIKTAPPKQDKQANEQAAP